MSSTPPPAPTYRRLYDTLEQTAVNAFGSVRQRAAAHLLDLASAQQGPAGQLAAHVSQQELADAVGSVREVVARVLRDFRVAGIIATAADRSVIVDPTRLYAESGGAASLRLWSSGARLRSLTSRRPAAWARGGGRVRLPG